MGRCVRLFPSAARSSERFCLRAALSGFAFAGNRLKFSESALCFSSYLASVCEPSAPLCFCIAEGRSVPLNSAQNFFQRAQEGLHGFAPRPSLQQQQQQHEVPRCHPLPLPAPLLLGRLVVFGVLSSAG